MEWKRSSTGKLISKWENVVLRVGARNGQEGRKPGGNETWLEANGTAQEAEEEEGERKGSGGQRGSSLVLCTFRRVGGPAWGVGLVQRWLKANDPGVISRSNNLGFSDFYHLNREGLMTKSKLNTSILCFQLTEKHTVFA